MKKSLITLFESKESVPQLGNHSLRIWRTPRETTMIRDDNGDFVRFECTREFRYFGSTICAVNDNSRTYMLSHCGVWAKNALGEDIVGKWPKTTTQTLLMYRDLFSGEGYQEQYPIEGRAAIDWRSHMNAYNERKAARKAAEAAWRAEHGEEPMPKPARKPRAKKAKAPKKSELMAAMMAALKANGIDYKQYLPEQNLPVPAESEPVFDYDEWEAAHAPAPYHPFDFDGESNLNTVHATRGFWELLEYYPHKEQPKKKTVRKVAKVARKTTAKKTSTARKPRTRKTAVKAEKEVKTA